MRNRLIILAIALVLIIGGSIAVLLLVKNSPTLQNAVYKVSNTKTTNTAVTNTAANVNQALVTPDTEALRFTARMFTERYGSFSNQADGSNLAAAADYATASFAASLRIQATQKVIDLAAPYHGVVTRALVFTTVKQTSTAATLTVSASQQITDGTTARTENHDLLIDEIKVNGEWKVNAAVWK